VVFKLSNFVYTLRMDNDKKLESEISEYARLAKEDKSIDVAALMINAIKNQDKNLVSPRAKKWAYLISIGVPPLGLLFALRYYFGDQDDAAHVANICLALTAVSVIGFFILLKVFFASSGTSVQQIEQITPAQIHELTQ
jgi:hypothetical protein